MQHKIIKVPHFDRNSIKISDDLDLKKVIREMQFNSDKELNITMNYLFSQTLGDDFLYNLQNFPGSVIVNIPTFSLYNKIKNLYEFQKIFDHIYIKSKIDIKLNYDKFLFKDTSNNIKKKVKKLK